MVYGGGGGVAGGGGDGGQGGEIEHVDGVVEGGVGEGNVEVVEEGADDRHVLEVGYPVVDGVVGEGVVVGGGLAAQTGFLFEKEDGVVGLVEADRGVGAGWTAADYDYVSG